MTSTDDKEWSRLDTLEFGRIQARGGGGLSDPVAIGACNTGKPLPSGAVDRWTGKPLSSCDPPVVAMQAYIRNHPDDADTATEALRVLFGDAATWAEELRNPLGGTTVVTHTRLGSGAWMARCGLDLKYPESVCGLVRQVPFFVQCAKSFKAQLAEEKATKTFWQNGFMYRMGAPNSPIPSAGVPDDATPVRITIRCPRAATDAQVRAWGAEVRAK